MTKAIDRVIAPARRTGWLLALVMLLAATLRAVHIGDAALWNDELFSRFYPETGLRFMWTEGFVLETTPPTYYSILLGWMRLFGSSEAALRSLSLLASVATLPLVFLLGREFLEPRGALLGTLVFAVLPMQVYYGQEARTYALMLLPVSLALLGTARFLRDEQDGGHLLAYGAGAVLTVYCHSTAALIVAAMNLSVLTTVVGRRPLVSWAGLLRWIVANAAVAVLCLPVAWTMLRQVGANRLSWIPPITIGGVGREFAVVIAGEVTHPDQVAAALALLLVVVLVAALRAVRPDRRAVTVLILVPVLDFALILLASLRQPILVARILCWMGVPLSVVLALALTQGGRMRRPLAAATAGVLGIGLTFQLVQGGEAKEPWPRFFARLQPEIVAADLLVFGPWTQPMSAQYYGQDMAKVRHWTEDIPPTAESTVIPRQIDAQEITRGELLTAIRTGRRVLLIQRQVETSFQHLLTAAVSPQRRVESDCATGWICLEAVYWASDLSSPGDQR
jgi:mannosyltransferase